MNNYYIINYLLIIFVIASMVTVFVIFYTYFNKNKVSIEKKIEIEREKHEQTLLSTQLEIQEQTFNHISREIHDHVGQRLTLARFYLSSMQTRPSEEMLSLSDDASQLIAEAISDLKQLSRSLTSTIIEDNGLFFALEQEIERVQRLVNWSVRMRIHGDSKYVSTGSELILFRIVQEALQNIIKYATPQHVTIDFYFLTDQVKLVIKDDGIGFDVKEFNLRQPAGKSGLANMKKRTAILNGTLSIQSKPGKGTSLSFTFPLNQTYA